MTAGEDRRDDVRQRGWFEVRWRQFRNAPRPVVRAVLSPLVVAIVLGLAYLAYDVALERGARPARWRPPGTGGDRLRRPRPGRRLSRHVPHRAPADRLRWASDRSPWSAALGLFAAVPIAYLILVVESQMLRPLFV